MHPAHFAATTPHKPACIMAETGQAVTYDQLEANSNRCAHMFRAFGLARGDHIAFLLENTPRFFEICWGAQRAGLYFTAISTRLLAHEVDYIVRDSGARLFITSAEMADTAEKLVPLLPAHVRRLMLGGEIRGYDSYDMVVERFPAIPIADQAAGAPMLYSSGTTGRPKGVKRQITGESFDVDPPGVSLFQRLYRFNSETVYLSPAPLSRVAGNHVGESVRGRRTPIAGLADTEGYARTAGIFGTINGGSGSREILTPRTARGCRIYLTASTSRKRPSPRRNLLIRGRGHILRAKSSVAPLCR